MSRIRGIALTVIFSAAGLFLNSCHSGDISDMVGDYYLHLASSENHFTFRSNGTGYLIDNRKNKNNPTTYEFVFERSGDRISLKRNDLDLGVGTLSKPSWYGDYVFAWQGETWYRKR